MYLITGIYVPCYSHITQTRFNVKLGSVKPGNKAYSAKRYWFHSLTTREWLSIRQKNYLLLYGYEKSNKQVLMRNRKENCGKSCVGAYCKQHNFQLKKGGEMPTPCRGCGVGVLYDGICLSCAGSTLKKRLYRQRKKAKETFQLVLLELKAVQLEKCVL